MAETLHSNYQIRWKNYRRFEDTGWITIKPLTILLGANNGGKSSVLSPLLLLSQTMASTDYEAPLLPFGPLIDLGSYKDFVHRHDPRRDLSFGVRFHTHDPKGKKLKPVGTYAPGGFELTFGAGTKPELLKLKRFEVTDIYNRFYFRRVAKKSGFSLDGAISIDEMKPEEKRAVEKAHPMNFLFAPGNTIYKLGEENGKDEKVDEGSFSKSFSHYLRATGSTYFQVRELLEDFSYVGPLRAKLSRFYRVSPEAPETVGSQGEHTANLFRRRHEKLKKQVNMWVKKFDFGEELHYRDLTDDLFQLVFKTNSELTNVADSGF